MYAYSLNRQRQHRTGSIWNVGFYLIFFFYLRTGSKFTILAYSTRAPMQQRETCSCSLRARKTNFYSDNNNNSMAGRACENKINEKKNPKFKSPPNRPCSSVITRHKRTVESSYVAVGRAMGFFFDRWFLLWGGGRRGAEGWEMGARDKRPTGNWQNPLASKVVGSKNILRYNILFYNNIYDIKLVCIRIAIGHAHAATGCATETSII